jgi:O-antigen/teichoic acid export membrane protein
MGQAGGATMEAEHDVAYSANEMRAVLCAIAYGRVTPTVAAGPPAQLHPLVGVVRAKRRQSNALAVEARRLMHGPEQSRSRSWADQVRLSSSRMVRRFFRDSAIYALPAALSRGISFFLFPLFAHYFTPHDYGTLDILFTVGSLVAVTVGLEISQGVGRYVAGLKEGEEHRAYASTALLFTIGAYSVFLIAVQLLAGPITDLVLGQRADPALIRVAAVWMWTVGIFYIAQNQLRWQLRASAYAISSALLAVVTAACSVLFVLVLDLGVMGALLGQLAGAIVALLYVFAVSGGTFAVRFDWDKCRQMLAFSLPLVPSGLGVFLNVYADRLIIQHVRSLSDVGVYGVGYRLAMVVSLVLVGFQGATMPLILARHAETSTPTDVARIFRIFSAIALSVFVLLSIMAAPLLQLLAPPAYHGAVPVVPFLVLGSAFAGMYMFAPGMAIAKDTGTIAKLTVAAGVANVLLVLALVPWLGILGAGIGTAVTSGAWFLSLMHASQRHYPVPHDWRALGTALLVAGGIVAVGMATLPPSGRALGGASLLARGAFVLAGVSAASWLALGRRERSTLASALKRARTRTRERA